MTSYMYILELYMYVTIHVMASSLYIGSVPVMDSGIINEWMTCKIWQWTFSCSGYVRRMYQAGEK
jgi:hypothetical protein